MRKTIAVGTTCGALLALAAGLLLTRERAAATGAEPTTVQLCDG